MSGVTPRADIPEAALMSASDPSQTFRHRRRDRVGLRSFGDSSRQAYGARRRQGGAEWARRNTTFCKAHFSPH
jgi:hypothetical protein